MSMTGEEKGEEVMLGIDLKIQIQRLWLAIATKRSEHIEKTCSRGCPEKLKTEIGNLSSEMQRS